MNSKDPKKVAAGRIGGYRLRATHDPQVYTAPARAAFLKRFWPGDPTLNPSEAQKRAEAALKAHMARLAYASAKARRSGKQGGAGEVGQ